MVSKASQTKRAKPLKAGKKRVNSIGSSAGLVNLPQRHEDSKRRKVLSEVAKKKRRKMMLVMVSK
ncbi:hypothetical protein [Parasediminibacterium sp. JCM 36343]|uniref:hypothetical protein n=1 Tax=Parasediminibacterium sp. JCM 36343 TaxID=3374279 RepID=UPI00397BE608